MGDYETVRYERPASGVARVVMHRPEARNAQNLQMTYDLSAAFDSALADDAVKVIILAGADPHFSAGHDLRAGAKNAAGRDFSPIGTWGGFAEPGAHVLTLASDEGLLDGGLKIRTMRLPDAFQEHDKPEKQYDEARLNAPHIVKTVLKALRVNSAGVEEVRA